MIILLGFIVGPIFVGLIIIDHWLTQAFAGFVLGVHSALWWVVGDAMQTEDYWHGTCSSWITLLTGQPQRQKIPWISLSRNHIVIKIMSLASIIIMTAIFTAITITGDVYASFVILFVLTSILGIILVERHFRQRYTHMTDWDHIIVDRWSDRVIFLVDDKNDKD